jgi:hypothetical protein
MSTSARARLTAWLGLIAMWLILFAPLVSQWCAASQRNAVAPETALCSVMHPAGQTASSSHGDRLAACGYCDLLSDHAAAPTLPAMPFTPLAILIGTAVVLLSTRHVPFGAFSNARSRAPPARFALHS